MPNTPLIYGTRASVYISFIGPYLLYTLSHLLASLVFRIMTIAIVYVQLCRYSVSVQSTLHSHLVSKSAI